MDIKKILELQKIFRRTKEGRKIGERAIPLIEETLSNPALSANEVIECLNCHILLNKDLFPEGCMNCGCKDVKNIANLKDKKVSKK